MEVIKSNPIQFGKQEFEVYYNKLLKSIPSHFSIVFEQYTQHLFFLCDKMFNEIQSKNKKTLDKYFNAFSFKQVVLDDTFEKIFKEKIEDDFYKSGNLILRTFKTYDDWNDAEKKYNLGKYVLFIIEARENRIKELIKTFLSASNSLIPIINNSRQGGGPKDNLPLYYSIIKTSKQKDPTHDFRNTISLLLKNKAEFNKLFNQDIFAKQTINFNQFLSDHNLTNNSYGMFTDFLCGDLQKRFLVETNLFKSFWKYYKNKSKKMDKKEILRDILKSLSITTPKK